METICTKCGGKMIPLFTSLVCKNECDLKPIKKLSEGSQWVIKLLLNEINQEIASNRGKYYHFYAPLLSYLNTYDFSKTVNTTFLDEFDSNIVFLQLSSVGRKKCNFTGGGGFKFTLHSLFISEADRIFSVYATDGEKKYIFLYKDEMIKQYPDFIFKVSQIIQDSYGKAILCEKISLQDLGIEV